MEKSRDPQESVIWLVSMCRFAEAIAIGMLLPVLPLLVAKLEAPGAPKWLATLTAEQLTGVLYCATGLAMSFIQILSGRLSDLLDRRKVFILTGMIGATFCSFYYAWLTSYVELLFTRVLQGIFLGLTFPPLMAIIARHSPPGKGGRTLGTYSTIRLLGFASGPVLGGKILESWGYEITFLLSAALLTASVLAVSLWIRDYRDQQPQRSKRAPPPPVQPIFRLLGAAIFLMMVGISIVVALFPYYSREFGASPIQLGLCLSAFIGSRCLLQYPMGWLGDRYDKKNVLLGALFLFIPLVALQGTVTSLGELIALRVGLGVVAAAISSSVSGIAAERSEPGNRARLMGINTFSFSLGVATGPMLGGFLPSAVAFTVPALAALPLLLIIAWLLPSDHKARRHAPRTVAMVEPEG